MVLNGIASLIREILFFLTKSLFCFYFVSWVSAVQDRSSAEFQIWTTTRMRAYEREKTSDPLAPSGGGLEKTYN